jgi:MFS family permease
MYAYTAVLVCAVITESVTTQWWHWTIAKVLSGTGIGAVQATIPLYINEQAPTQLRGFLVVSYSLSVSSLDLKVDGS